METRSAPFVVGLFVFAVLAGVAAFLLWLSEGPFAERVSYVIAFEDSATGLTRGSEVHFRGIRVGEVTDLELGPDPESAVVATIALDPAVPLHEDTAVDVEFRGLAGVPVISLTGGSAIAPRLVPVPGEPSVLRAPAEAGQDWTQAAREGFRRIDRLLSENAEPLGQTIADISAFADALARNADRVDTVLGGLERMVGEDVREPVGVFDLRAPSEFPRLERIPDGQLAISMPTAILLLDTQRMMVEAADGRISSIPHLQWSDSLPRLVQARLVEGFENAGYLGVSADVPEIVSDHHLLLELREFQIVEAGAREARVSLVARIVDLDGAIVDARRFHGSAPVDAAQGSIAAAALSSAFVEAGTELIIWALAVLR